MSAPAWCPDPIAQRWWDGTNWTDHTRVEGEIGPSGPVADPVGQPPAGWYSDPMAERWWDGAAWTTQTRVHWPPVSLDLDPSPSGLSTSEVAKTATRRRRLVSVVVTTAVLLGLVIAVAVAVTSGGDRTDPSAAVTSAPTPPSSPSPQSAPSITAPAGAIPVEAEGGTVRVTTEESTRVSIATCPGLLAEVPASSCVDMETDGVAYALTLTELDDGVTVSAYEFEITGAAITATLQLVGTLYVPAVPGTTLTVEAARVPVTVGDVFGLVSTVRSDQDETSTVEFFSAASGDLAPSAVLVGGRAELAADGSSIAVMFDNDEQSRRFTTLFPVAGTWMSVTEVLEKSVADDRFEVAGPVETSEIVVRTVSPPRETTPATTAPFDDGLGAVGTIIDGFPVPCDGSWITIVASRPLEQVADVLARNPGTRAVKNADACPSLNPTFASGSLAGRDIYVVFYGPFDFLDEARGTCNQLGLFEMNDCFVAPLTFNEADRNLRYGPL